MTLLQISDPLALVGIQAGQVPPPDQEQGAAAARSMDVEQEAHKIGDPVPIVFARRVGAIGGIMIAPRATEARFENDLANAVTASYHLILGEGQMGDVQVRDVFQSSCRQGTHTQTYDRRAGSWLPGNFIVPVPGFNVPQCPNLCGTVGTYPGMTTLSFTSGAIPDGFTFWDRQIHIFTRAGLYVTRYEDDIIGPSNSFPDLIKWALVNSSRWPVEMINDDSLAFADLFCRTNFFSCDCEIRDSRNLLDLIADWAPYFLLANANVDGKKGLRPILPTLNTGEINTGTITPDFTFDEQLVIPGSVEIDYIPRSDRQPFVCQVIWRQQLEDDFGIVRTANIRFTGTAADGPYESHDLSEFCTNELHAAKIGAYLLGKRVYTSHTVRFAVKPGTHAALEPGAIVRLRLERNAQGFTPGVHDYLYQIERIRKTLAGELSYEASHFPINDEWQSLLALTVDAATGTGVMLDTNRTGPSCDLNSSEDETIPDEDFLLPDYDTGDNPFGEPMLDPEDEEVEQLEEFGDAYTGLGGVGEEANPNDTIGPPPPAPGDPCTYEYRVVRVCGDTTPPIPISIDGVGYTGYIVDPADAGCTLRFYTIKHCPDEEPEITEQLYDIGPLTEFTDQEIQLPAPATVEVWVVRDSAPGLEAFYCPEGPPQIPWGTYNAITGSTSIYTASGVRSYILRPLTWTFQAKCGSSPTEYAGNAGAVLYGNADFTNPLNGALVNQVFTQYGGLYSDDVQNNRIRITKLIINGVEQEFS